MDYPNARIERFYDDVLNGVLVEHLGKFPEDKGKQQYLDTHYNGARLELVKSIVESNAEKYI